MSVVFYKARVLIEDATGNFVELPEVKSINHFGISQFNFSKDSLNFNEVPYCTIKSDGNVNIVNGRFIKIQYGTATELVNSEIQVTFNTIFVGRIQGLDETKDYTKGEVQFRARNNLSFLTQRYFGDGNHFYKEVEIDYNTSLDEYELPEEITDVFAVKVNDRKISENLWIYNFLTKKVVFFKRYSATDKIVLVGHYKESLKTIVENIITREPGVTIGGTVTDSLTKLDSVYFGKRTSFYKGLVYLANIYNYRVFADKDGNIRFQPIKIDTDLESQSIDETLQTSIDIDRRYLSVNNVFVNGDTLTIKKHNRQDNIFDDFEDNANVNNWGGRWEIVNTNKDNTVEPAPVWHPSFEKANYGAKVNINFVGAGECGLKSTFTASGDATDLSDYTGIKLLYRSTAPLIVKLNDAYFYLPATNYQTTKQIAFSSFRGTLDLRTVSSMTFVLKNESGAHEFFIDYIAFYPEKNTLEEFTDFNLKFEYDAGYSGEAITVDLPFISNYQILQDVGTSFLNHYKNGVNFYRLKVNTPDTIAEIGDLIKVTNTDLGLVDQKLEVRALDFYLGVEGITVEYLLEEPYTFSELTNIRQNDILSNSQKLILESVTGSGVTSQAVFNRYLKELIAESRYNYAVTPPCLRIIDVSGSGTTIIIDFGAKIIEIDKDFFKTYLIDGFIKSLAGSGSTATIEFKRLLEALSIDEEDFRIFIYKTFLINTITKISNNQIKVTFTNKIQNFDKDFFKIYKII